MQRFFTGRGARSKVWIGGRKSKEHTTTRTRSADSMSYLTKQNVCTWENKAGNHLLNLFKKYVGESQRSCFLRLVFEGMLFFITLFRFK